jgi:hypothetical protein
MHDEINIPEEGVHMMMMMSPPFFSYLNQNGILPILRMAIG